MAGQTVKEVLYVVEASHLSTRQPYTKNPNERQCPACQRSISTTDYRLPITDTGTDAPVSIASARPAVRLHPLP
jgi:hypothetical protein